jgi:ketosteroid isomerase-like protein
MDDVEAFLEEVIPGLTEAETVLHNGDAGPRKLLWSRTDPVTLFGAAMSKTGADEVASSFDFLASRFSNCSSFEYHVIAAGVSADLAYVVGVEHTTASIGGEPPMPYSLRVTTIFRREDGAWKIVHRHGDALPDADIDSTHMQINRLGYRRSDHDR